MPLNHVQVVVLDQAKPLQNMPTQHIATLLGASSCVCYVAIHSNKVAKLTQHVEPNNVPIHLIHMLQLFGRGFTPNANNNPLG